MSQHRADGAKGRARNPFRAAFGFQYRYSKYPARRDCTPYLAGSSAGFGEVFGEIDTRIGNIERAASLAFGFVRTTFSRAVITAVTRARDGKHWRVVVALSGTGAGKTETGRHLERNGAVYVEGRKCWRASY